MTKLRPEAVLIVFLKAPIPGRVKTRLASELGDAGAARLYEAMARATVDRMRGGSFRLVAYFDPPDHEAAIRDWIGDDPETTFLPQPAGDLGLRLRHAFSWGFDHADVVCVVGTDIPELERADVEEAIGILTAVDPVDVALGPARDGGYYLLGLRKPHPRLFDAVPWSTGAVLTTTLARAKNMGLSTGLLRTLVDVDSAEDLAQVAGVLAALREDLQETETGR